MNSNKFDDIVAEENRITQSSIDNLKHPSDGPFSPRDLNTFFSAPNMAILMVIGNKGSIYIIEKTIRDSIENNFIKIKKVLILYRQHDMSFDEVIKELELYGIKYSKC